MVCCLAHMCTHPLVRAQLTLATATDNLLLIFTLGESLGGHCALEAFMLRVPRPVQGHTIADPLLLAAPGHAILASTRTASIPIAKPPAECI